MFLFKKFQTLLTCSDAASNITCTSTLQFTDDLYFSYWGQVFLRFCNMNFLDLETVFLFKKIQTVLTWSNAASNMQIGRMLYKCILTLMICISPSQHIYFSYFATCISLILWTIFLFKRLRQYWHSPTSNMQVGATLNAFQ